MGGFNAQAIVLRNVTDDTLTVQLRSESEDFLLPDAEAIIGPREVLVRAVHFVPRALGSVTGTVELSIGAWRADLSVGGYGGGARVTVADLELGPIACFVGAHDRDARFFVVTNDANPAEGARADWTWNGDFTNSGCDVILIGAPVLLGAGQSVTLRLEVDGEPGLHHCTLNLASQPRPVSFHVSWEGQLVAPCDLDFGELHIDTATLRGSFTITNRTERCLLTSPRVEPLDAGTIDVPWQWYWLEGGQSITVPVMARSAGEAVINVADPIQRSRRVPMQFN